MKLLDNKITITTYKIIIQIIRLLLLDNKMKLNKTSAEECVMIKLNNCKNEITIKTNYNKNT